MRTKNGKNGRVKMDPNSVLVMYGPDALRKCVDDAMRELGLPPDSAYVREAPAQDQTAKTTTPAIDLLEKTAPPPAAPSSTSTALSFQSQSGGITIRGDRITFTFADRTYEVDALSKNRAPGILSVTIHARRGKRLFADRIEMCTFKDRNNFIRACAAAFETEGDVVASDLKQMHEKLRERQDSMIAAAAEVKPARVVPPMSERERREAVELLMSPRLITLITKHFAESGYVGEEMNLLTGYIACTSRLLLKPVHVLFQSSTASGKTTLMNAAVSMMPPEEVFGYNVVSSKALQYMQERDLRHCIFILEEDKRLDESARENIKMLKTQGWVSSLITVRDPETGMQRAVDFFVEGPLAFLMTTTALFTDEEQANRDFICTADETTAQTEAIQEMQRRLRTLEGLALTDRKEEIQKLHQNAQRLLRKLKVINPYAPYMKFPAHAHRLRRDHEKYLGLIDAVTLLHQYQREIKTRTKSDGTIEEYIEATLEDIETANKIALFVLGQSLDECPPHTRTFLEQASQLVEARAEKDGVERAVVRVTASELAEETGLSVQMVRRHLGRLIDLEIVWADGAENRNSPFRRYAVPHGAKTGDSRVLAGLLDVHELARRAQGTGNSKKPAGN